MVNVANCIVMSHLADHIGMELKKTMDPIVDNTTKQVQTV